MNKDPHLIADLEAICEERKAILIYDGRLSEPEAETYVTAPRFIQKTIQSISFSTDESTNDKGATHEGALFCRDLVPLQASAHGKMNG